jgi:23S rRNA (uridine2552-2'-O)-methyltransferase
LVGATAEVASHLADALNQFGFSGLGQFGDLRGARDAIVERKSYLDQFMMFQGKAELGQQRRSQTLVADLDNRFERVRKTTQVAALRIFERGARHRAGTGGVKRDSVSCCIRTSNGHVMARSKSSERWLKEHFADPFVKRAQAEGWRSRAVFKLEELLERDRLLKPGMTVVDLGAAPGGWSQMVREQIRDSGRIIALDILPMQGIVGVEFILGDFREETVLHQLESSLSGQRVDLVLSDMAPNMSGVESVDQARIMHLVELAQEFADKHLKPGGAFLVKLFHGRGSDEYLKNLRRGYERVSMRKPKASRSRSSEVYALATGKR